MPGKQHGILRKFNRAVVNPITKLFAGHFFYALVYHQGRRSGKTYSTPVVVVKKDQFFYCPLPYGVDTDWYLNVKSANTCGIKINGILYSANTPEIINESEALPFFSPTLKKAFSRAKISNFLRLRLAD